MSIATDNGFTESEWEELSAEERDAISDVDDDGDDADEGETEQDDSDDAALKTAAEKPADEEEGDEEGDEDDADADPEEADEDAPTDQTQDDDAQEDAPAPAEQPKVAAAKPEPAHHYAHPIPSVRGFDQKLAANAAAADDLAERFGTGEMDFSEYYAKNKQVQAEREDLIIAKSSAVAEKVQADRQWERDINSFWNEAGNDAFSKGLRYVAMQDAVAQIEATPAGKALSGVQLLRQAKAMVVEELGLAVDAVIPSKDTPKPFTPAKGKKKVDVPKTLGGVPAAKDADDLVKKDEFSRLDELDGIELENALARMTVEQQEKYLAGA